MVGKRIENTAKFYEIKVQGHLDTKWSEWLYSMTITHESDDTTSLYGMLPDQVVLHSVLDRIRDMNLQLISVNQIDSSGKSMDGDDKEASYEM